MNVVINWWAPICDHPASVIHCNHSVNQILLIICYVIHWLRDNCHMVCEKAMAPHSSTLAWKIPWAEEPGALQSMGLLGVGHDWVASLSLFTFTFSLSYIGEGNGNPLQCSCLENPRDRGAWWAAVYGVAQSRTRLMRLSSSSSSHMVWGFPGVSVVNNLPDSHEFSPWVRKIPWRKKWQPAPVFLSGKPWAEEPARLQSMETQRIRHDWAHTHAHTHTTDFYLFKSRCVCVSSHFNTVLAYKNS